MTAAATVGSLPPGEATGSTDSSGVEVEPVNLAIYSELAEAARLATPARTLETLDAIAEARVRIEGNVAPALALEAVLVSAVRNRETVPAPSRKDPQ